MPPPISRPCTTPTAVASAALPLHSHRLNPRTAGYVGCSHGACASGDRVRLPNRSPSLFLKLGCARQPGADRMIRPLALWILPSALAAARAPDRTWTR